MVEAEMRGGKFIGTVGVMDESKGDALQFESICRKVVNSGVEVSFRDP